jgi:ketosteroid isomerase-like protein
VPSANVELVRSIYAAWERGDFSSTAWADPEIEYVVADGPAPGHWKGLARLTEVAREFLGTWEQFHVRADEYRELDGERVLVLAYQSGRGKTSGLDIGQVQAERAHVFHVRGDKVTRLVIYYDRERALADLGVAPEAGSSGS